MLQTTRRIHLEVSFAPHGVVPPSDSYTGAIREDFELRLDHLEAAGGCALSGDGGSGHGGARRLQLAVDRNHLAGFETVLQV